MGKEIAYAIVDKKGGILLYYEDNCLCTYPTEKIAMSFLEESKGEKVIKVEIKKIK